MNTPWGDLAVADAHVHFLSARFFQVLAEQKGAPVTDGLNALGIESADADATSLAHRWVQELDRHGVSSAAIIASVPADEDSVLAAVRAYPDRFYAYFILDPTRPDAVARANTAIDGGARAVCLFPAMHRFSMHDDRVTAVLDAVAQRPGVPVFVHCGVLSVGIRAKLGVPSRFDMRFSNPVDVHAVALRYPNVPFLLPHFGAGYYREALMLADLCPNVYFDTSSSNSWVNYQIPAVVLRDVFRRSLDVLGPRRLLFGTDSSFFPRGWMKGVFDAQAALLFDLGVSAEDAQLIFGANLQRIFTKH